MSTFVYKSTDAGAPVITSTAGSFRDMLKKCLVTGFGALPGAGWTEQFVSGTTSVFAPVGASNGATATPGSAVLHVVDPSAPVSGFTSSSTGVCLRMFDSMTSAAVGVNGTFLTGVPGVDKGGFAVPTSRCWVLVATPTTVHFMASYPGDRYVGNSVQHFTFGKFDSLLPGDVNNSIIWTGGQIANNDAGCVNLYGQYMAVARDYTGLGGARTVNLSSGLAQSYLSESVGVGNALTFPNQIDGKLHLLPLRIYEPNAGYRGVVSGLLSSNCLNAPFSSLDTVNGEAGKTYVVMQGYGAGQWVFLETSSTW